MLNARQYRTLGILAAGLGLGFLWLEYRLGLLQILRHQELRQKAQAYTQTLRRERAWRGDIRDRDGVCLAVSAPVKTVFVDLATCSNHLQSLAAVVAPWLGSSPAELEDYLSNQLARSRAAGTPPPRGLLLRRQLGTDRWQGLTNALGNADFGIATNAMTRRDRATLHRLRHRALFARDSQLRMHPRTNLLSQVIGYVGPTGDGRFEEGVTGIERALNRELAGASGECSSEQDAAGNELAYRRVYYRPPRDGQHVELTIDHRIQQVVEEELTAAMTRHEPRLGSVLVLRPATGEILAWAGLPSGALLAPGEGPEGVWRNHAVQERLEPGSTLKTLVLAAVINERLASLDQPIYCGNGLFIHEGLRLRDHVPHGWLTVRDGYIRSSNIAFAQLALRLGAIRLHHYFTNFGLAELTGIPIPGEVRGYVPKASDWTAAVLTRAGMGQGISATQLGLACAIGAVANEGRLMQPQLVRRILDADGNVLWSLRPRVRRTVVRPAVARQVLEAMQGVVGPKGTGGQAASAAYTTGGKTGTAQKATRNGYLPDAYYTSFIGVVPARQPELLVAVALDEPRHGAYGGTVAAPLFRAVIDRIAPLWGLAPDKAALAILEESTGGWTESEPVSAVNPTAPNPRG